MTTEQTVNIEGLADAIATITPAPPQKISGPPLPLGLYCDFSDGTGYEGVRYYYAYRSPDGTVHLEEQFLE